MIELITGSPGAGKTTFAVATRIAAEAKRQIELDADTCVKLQVDVGTKVTRRIVVAGVRGLVVEHERLPHILTRDATSPAEVERWNAMKTEASEGGKPLASDDPVHQRLPGDPAKDVPCLMQNWWLWCKPGDLIVIDEAQFVMPRGVMGKKPPYWLQAMEIHRHYGVDFLLITQHPQLIDTTVRALVGLHRHVRSVMGSSVCMVYTWDHASNPERYNMANKGQFIRRAKHYKLFHSSAAHVKPPSSGRWGLIVAPLLLFGGVGGLIWKVQAFGGDKQPAIAAAARPASAASAASAGRTSGHTRPAGFIDVPKLSGCYAWGDRCECVDEVGRRVRIAASMCKVSSQGFDGLVAWEPRKPVEPPPEGAKPATSAPEPIFARPGG
jgi:zona occludens toxin